MRYTRQDRIHMISSLLSRSFISTFGSSLLNPKYFEAEDEILLAKYIIGFINKYKHPPSSVETLLMFAGEDRTVIADATSIAFEYAKDSSDSDYEADEIIQFAKTAAVKQALIQSIDDIEQGNIDKPVERLVDASKVGAAAMDIGVDVVADADEWISDLHIPKIPTGFLHVDGLLHGGLARKELGIVLAPPNAGKTQTLINIGIGAAGLVGGCDVVHFSLEMNAASVSKRYAARMVFRFQDLYEDDIDYVEQLHAIYRNRIRGSVRVQSYAPRQLLVSDIYVKLDQLIAQEIIDPEKLCVIVDYADLLRATLRDERLGLIRIYEDLRALGTYFNCPVWSASQAGRQALKKAIIRIDDFAEAFGKAAVADVVISKCATIEEEREKEGRFFMAKIRDEKGAGTSIAFKEHEESMAIVTTGITKYTDEDFDKDSDEDSLADAVKRSRKRRSRR